MKMRFRSLSPRPAPVKSTTLPRLVRPPSVKVDVIPGGAGVASTVLLPTVSRRAPSVSL
jgi:hypothetical protein